MRLWPYVVDDCMLEGSSLNHMHSWRLSNCLDYHMQQVHRFGNQIDSFVRHMEL